MGKQILYADSSTQAQDATAWIDQPAWGHLPMVADLPEPGSVFSAGQPVCTVFARGPTEAECRRQLAEREAWFRSEYTVVLESP